ncbi:zinc ribbon domain-containing protein [Halorubrum halophilum]|uniref:zinc ribbon domain-containing protein n=1 Tax=Halorubrum halophilum TaxID=413816 RepID=UPI0006797276|nr:zinc ribbon domain-containing protein [Halorubrum halophilum]
MPSDDSETEYSVFDDERTDERDRATDDRDRSAGDRDRTAGDQSPATDDRHDSIAAGEGRGCPKCGGEETETDEIATSGTGLTKMLDVQNRQFTVVSCADCGYSELYKGRSTGDAIDFFIG